MGSLMPGGLFARGDFLEGVFFADEEAEFGFRVEAGGGLEVAGLTA